VVHPQLLFLEVAHRYGDELLLWDGWGAISAGPGPTVTRMSPLGQPLARVELTRRGP
jgi:hypothetical protein